MLSVAATYVFTMVLPYIKIGDVGWKNENKYEKNYAVEPRSIGKTSQRYGSMSV